MMILSIPFAGATDLTSMGAPSEDNRTHEQIVQDLLDNPNYSVEAKRNLMIKEALFAEASKEATLYNTKGMNATAYLVNVMPIKQEDSTKCGPAVVQMVLRHMGYTYESQTTIQNVIKGKDTMGTSMSKVLDYLNSHQEDNLYAECYFTDEASLRLFLDVASQLNLPVVFTAKVFQTDVTAGRWPYKTGGHFTVLRGINSSGKYPIADPFYYKKYVAGSDDSGVHLRTWNDIEKVNKNYGKKTDRIPGVVVGYIGY